MSKRKQTPKSKKATFRVRNWSTYNRSLVNRGSITIWIDENVIATWHPEPTITSTRRPTAVFRSSDRMPADVEGGVWLALSPDHRLRAIHVVIDLLDADDTMPDYTLLCKRNVDLAVALAPNQTNEPKHIVVNSTGLKIYGEGEWKVRQHGYSKRRTWRKLHLSVDEKTRELQAVEGKEANVDDAQAGKKLLAQTPGEIDQVNGARSYDKRKFYDAATECDVKRIVATQ